MASILEAILICPTPSPSDTTSTSVSEVLPRFLLYVALGCGLLSLNVWYVRGLVRSFRSSGALVAPIQIVGAERSDHGSALAHLLVARLDRIDEEMALANAALEPVEGHDMGRLDMVAEPASPLLIETFRPLDLDVRVGGLELTGVLSWIQRALVEERILQLSLLRGADGARVSGNWSALGIESFTLNIDDSGDGAVIDAIAYEVAYRQYRDRTPEAGALGASEFRSLLTILSDLAEHNRLVAAGRRPAAELTDLYERVAPLADRAVGWEPLQQLAASLAERAGALEEALARYVAQRDRLLQGQGTVPDGLRDKIADLRRSVDARIARALSSEGEGLGDGGIRTIVSSDLAALREVLSIPDLDMTDSPPTIGIPGPLPAGFADPRIEVIETGDHQEPGSALTEYVLSVLDAVRLVAPEARFLAAPIADPATVPLADAIVKLARANVDVILVPYGPLEASVFAPLLTRVSQEDIFVVLSAGMAPKPQSALLGTPLPDLVVFAGAVDSAGERAGFSAPCERCVWAPGVDIQLSTPQGGLLRRSGTAYSAALTAGVIARLLDRRPDLAPVTLAADLRRSASSRGGGPPILSLSGAFELSTEIQAPNELDPNTHDGAR